MSAPKEMVLKSLQNLDPKGEGPSSAPGAMSRRIVTAGGGAHRLAKLFMDSLTVEVVPFKEMESLVSGLTFLHENKPKDEAALPFQFVLGPLCHSLLCLLQNRNCEEGGHIF